MSDPVSPAPVPPGGPDYAAVKQRQQAGWASGDFAVIGVTLQLVGESLAEAADIRAHEDVIDVAAGNGNATLAAARRFARVVSTDYVPARLEKGRARAEAEGLAVTFQVADAEVLPFADASFDAALSTFGVMFAPDHRRAAEMLRVLRPGGRIGLANWTPDGFIGQLFRIVGKHVPPPAGLIPPARWGEEGYLRDLFGPAAQQIPDPRAAQVLQLPLRLRRALAARVSPVLRPRAQGLRRTGPGRRRRAGAGSARPARSPEYGRPPSRWWCRANIWR